MSFNGILRPVDNLGRLVIPREFRKLLDVKDGEDSFEMYINDNKELVLKKYCPVCTLCSSNEGLMDIEGKLICKKCIQKISEMREI